MLIAIAILSLLSICIIYTAGIGFLSTNHPVPIIPPDQSITVHGATYRYRMHGTGEPAVILLHGFGNSLEEWSQIAPRIRNRRVIALDLLGFGGSERSQGSYSITAQSRSLRFFLQAMGVEQAILVGRSMGASIAAWMGATNASHITGLVLIAPSAFPGSLTYPWPRQWLYRPGICNRITGLLINNGLFKKVFPDSIAPQAISVTASYDNRFANALETISLPTVVVWSRGDKTVPFAFHQEYILRIKHSRFVEIPDGVGHSVTRNAPEQTAEIINQFIHQAEGTE